jgi:hypothetical protein
MAATPQVSPLKLPSLLPVTFGILLQRLHELEVWQLESHCAIKQG